MNPYLGRDAVEPFLKSARSDGRGVFVLVRTSNAGGGQFQNLVSEGRPLFLHVAQAVGEWARIWPLQQLIRAMGAYFVRRNSNNPVYRRVLERYVHMATEAGVAQAMYPEGGLSRDGRLREPLARRGNPHFGQQRGGAFHRLRT